MNLVHPSPKIGDITSNRPYDLNYDLQNTKSKSNPVNVIFKNISYTVQVEKKVDHFQIPCKKETEPKHILKSVSGIFKAGEITAILGASGAGKTSLMNIIACRVAHKSEGKLYANTT